VPFQVVALPVSSTAMQKVTEPQPIEVRRPGRASFTEAVNQVLVLVVTWPAKLTAVQVLSGAHDTDTPPSPVKTWPALDHRAPDEMWADCTSPIATHFVGAVQATEIAPPGRTRDWYDQDPLR